jgi:hypothetical protein
MDLNFDPKNELSTTVFTKTLATSEYKLTRLEVKNIIDRIRYRTKPFHIELFKVLHSHIIRHKFGKYISRLDYSPIPNYFINLTDVIAKSMVVSCNKNTIIHLNLLSLSIIAKNNNMQEEFQYLYFGEHSLISTHSQITTPLKTAKVIIKVLTKVRRKSNNKKAINIIIKLLKDKHDL